MKENQIFFPQFGTIHPKHTYSKFDWIDQLFDKLFWKCTFPYMKCLPFLETLLSSNSVTKNGYYQKYDKMYEQNLSQSISILFRHQWG